MSHAGDVFFHALFLSGLLWCSSAGQSGNPRSGTEEFSFLSRTQSARPAGMAYAHTALAEGTDAVGLNPSGLSIDPEKQLFSLGYKRNFTDLSGGEMSFPFQGNLGVSYVLSFDFCSYGSIEEIDGDGSYTGRSITPSRSMAALTAARPFGPRLKTGLTFKIPTQYLGGFENSQLAVGWGADFGIQFQPGTRHLTFGLVVLNLGRKEISHTYQGETGGLLPAEFRTGVAVNSLRNKKLKYAFDICIPYHNNWYAAAGAEYELLRPLQLRLGGQLNAQEAAYYWKTLVLARDIEPLSAMDALKFTCGLSVIKHSFTLDYAGQYWHLLGIEHFVTLKFPLGELLQR